MELQIGALEHFSIYNIFQIKVDWFAISLGLIWYIKHMTTASITHCTNMALPNGKETQPTPFQESAC